MGNFHCVPSGCAEVVYQEYLAPKIRYRYPGEDWREILWADDYSTVTTAKYDTSSDFNYIFTAKARCSTSSPPPDVNPDIPRNFQEGQEIVVVTTGFWSGPILDFKKVVNGNNVNGLITYTNRTGGNSTSATCVERAIEVTLSTRNASNNGNVRLKSVSGSYGEPVVYGDIYDIQFIPTTTPPRACINSITNTCTFKALKQGEVLYEETRSVCPEVQKLSCRISDEVKSIKFEKLPYLERAEVVDYFYDVRQGGLIDSDNYGLFLSKGKIPDECLNIYRNDITSIIPNDFASITNTPENGFNLVAQICSAPSCPPPKYGVVCNDECIECTECPPGTHPLICDDIVCCYGDDGKVVLEIPKSDYCGGESCCE